MTELVGMTFTSRKKMKILAKTSENESFSEQNNGIQHIVLKTLVHFFAVLGKNKNVKRPSSRFCEEFSRPGCGPEILPATRGVFSYSFCRKVATRILSFINN